jgi:hypothetical protein
MSISFLLFLIQLLLLPLADCLFPKYPQQVISGHPLVQGSFPHPRLIFPFCIMILLGPLPLLHFLFGKISGNCSSRIVSEYFLGRLLGIFCQLPRGYIQLFPHITLTFPVRFASLGRIHSGIFSFTVTLRE